MTGAQLNAQSRRRIAIDALGSEISTDPDSASARLAGLLGQSRPLAVSADIDGLVSASMLASVAPGFEIVAFSIKSHSWLVHPDFREKTPSNLMMVDLFSPRFDSLSNHVVRWGSKRPQSAEIRGAYQYWDGVVDAASRERLLAVPSLWAATQGGYEDVDRADSARYKYPLGTAQFLLAMLEASGHAPRFYDRTYLPWLVANCDDGILTYTRYSDNARVWWPVLAGAVGPGSLTEQIFSMVDRMRPHDFVDAVHRLDRERAASGTAPWLDDKWNLSGSTPATLAAALGWLGELTGWRDPLRGGVADLNSWVTVQASGTGAVHLAGVNKMSDLERSGAADRIRNAANALNANFYYGGRGDGSRFNWVGGWA
ncbi:hypothetical protein [Agrococcus jenensis]|uniref:Uncharacterized protein n=1 Tax=Agrococcus jenensis TaxID=46353 RepID=A0A3N2ARK2_9MICO|nr:hypothetical protein [Agrococcus jenensis]ROR65342.1 hypothetical protein EDD26_0708 [Agrococcus jenensis]